MVGPSSFASRVAAGAALLATRTDALLNASAAFVAEHNKRRALHGAPALKSDPQLQKSAQQCADAIAKSGKMNHGSCDTRGAGENLAMSSPTAGAAKTLTQWYEGEKKLCTFTGGKAACKGGAGHLTQVIWASTKSVGCAESKGNGAVYTVCHYAPAGNNGQDAKNVLPLNGAGGKAAASKGAVKGAPNAAPQAAGKGAPKGALKGAPKGLLKAAPNAAPKAAGKGAPKGALKGGKVAGK